MWQTTKEGLYKRFEFQDFKQAFEFMSQVANLAEKQHHHPKWTNTYNKVDIWLISHEAGAVTDKDHKLAGAIDKLDKAK